ncbi:MAG: redoxin domain-containing protein [Myxococcota bacterium]
MSEELDLEALERPPGPWPAIRAWAVNLLGFVALALAALWVGGWLRAPALPERAPDFALRDLDGVTVTLAELRGRTVVLNFWATWCGPCRMEMPTFSAFAAAHPEITMLGIAADGPAARARVEQVADGLSSRYRVLLADPQVLEAYRIGAYPTTVVVDPEGHVRSAHGGLVLRPQLAWAAGVWW